MQNCRELDPVEVRVYAPYGVRSYTRLIVGVRDHMTEELIDKRMENR